jgi:hypothetical protein
MPPCLTAYVLTKRDESVLRRFIENYVDKSAADEQLRDEDLLMPPRDPALENVDDAYGWEPARSLEHALQRGLEDPSLAFALYLPPRSLDCHVTIAFTHDGKAVLGLEVDDPLNEPGPLERMKALLQELLDSYECQGGFICVEEPPPLDEQAFRRNAERLVDVMRHLGRGI